MDSGYDRNKKGAHKKLHKNGPGEIRNHRKITFNYQNLSGM